jgi:hypothetical protein
LTVNNLSDAFSEVILFCQVWRLGELAEFPLNLKEKNIANGKPNANAVRLNFTNAHISFHYFRFQHKAEPRFNARSN